MKVEGVGSSPGVPVMAACLAYRPRIVRRPIAVLLTLALTFVAALVVLRYGGEEAYVLRLRIVAVLLFLYPGIFVLIRARADHAARWINVVSLTIVALGASAVLLCVPVLVDDLVWFGRFHAFAIAFVIVCCGAAQGLCLSVIDTLVARDTPPRVVLVGVSTFCWVALGVCLLFKFASLAPPYLIAFGAVLAVAPHAALVPAVGTRQGC